jgi:hypothetical protein
MNSQLLIPMVVYVFYIGMLQTYLLKVRINAVRTKKVSRAYYKTFSTGETQPPDALVAGRHFDNQFQVPNLFFIGCVAHLVINQVNGLTVGLAWGFVVARWMHSFVHLGPNHIYSRIATFGLGWLMVLGLWAQLGYYAI